MNILNINNAISYTNIRMYSYLESDTFFILTEFHAINSIYLNPKKITKLCIKMNL